jgi:hypothetical protein|tara:strand:+ start:182 stop:1072 length:891 start_codon:yes stop_codon:yes gene_type:complete
MLNLLKIQDYMQKATRGEVTVSPSAILDFANECKESVEVQINKRREYRIRMSGLGRPLCQQLLDRSGLKEEMDYNALFRFLFGDLVESVAVLIMEQAGVEIVEKQKAVELQIAGHKVQGTLDLILRDEMGQDKVWDVKSASEWAFKFKYTGYGGYDKIKEDDPFGYIMQGHLYGEATGLPFGGWIVINKSSGEVAVVEAPEWQDEDRRVYMADAEKRVKRLLDPDPDFVKPFKSEFETYKIKGEEIRTGNKILPKICSMCGYRSHCWSKAKLHGKITSKAKSQPKVWYDVLKKKEL